MKLRNAVIALITLSLAVVAYAAPPKTAVYKVDRVTAKLEGNTVVIHAYGKVRSSGWKDAELVATKGTATTLTFRFVATKPTGIVQPIITPIDAEKTTGPLLPPFPRRVKIIAETNSKTVSITH